MPRSASVTRVRAVHRSNRAPRADFQAVAPDTRHRQPPHQTSIAAKAVEANLVGNGDLNLPNKLDEISRVIGNIEAPLPRGHPR